METPQIVHVDNTMSPNTSGQVGHVSEADEMPDTHLESHSGSLGGVRAHDAKLPIRRTTRNRNRQPHRDLEQQQQSMAIPRHIFLASLGNPAPYSNTLHSAGHILLDALSTHLNLPPLSRNPSLKPGLSTSHTELGLTLWQSPVQMNISGKPLVQVWKSYLSGLPADTRSTAKLYILHDELEAQLGKVKIRHTGSAKGHNGLKSVISTFGGKQDAFSRVGVGIGRPESRDPKEVSHYVLRACRPNEISAIRGAAAEVARLLEIG